MLNCDDFCSGTTFSDDRRPFAANSTDLWPGWAGFCCIDDSNGTALAQWTRRWTRNRAVAGSIPPLRRLGPRYMFFQCFFHIFSDVLRACLVEVWHVFGRRLGHIFHICLESVKTTRDRFSHQICLNMKPPGRSKGQNNAKNVCIYWLDFFVFFPVWGPGVD